MSAKSLAEAPQFETYAPTEADPHKVLEALRPVTPIARDQRGIAFALRARHAEIVLSDATRQLETEH